jgi:hypothetical protein
MTADLLPFDDAAYQSDPYPYYDTVRALTPVYGSPLGVHVVTRYRDVVRLLRDRRLSARQLDFGVASIFHDSVLGQDSPDHTRLRRISSQWFTPELIRRWSAEMRRQVAVALDKAERDGGLDVVEDLAFPATFATMAHILGVGTHEAAECRRRVLDIGRALRPSASDGDVAGAEQAFGWYVGYIRELIADKRRHPGDGMLDAFLAAEADGRMSQAEVLATTTLFYAVGHLDNSFLIENGIRILAGEPKARERFVADPDSRPAMIGEILRYDTPEQFVTRYVTEDIDVDGHVVPGGGIVLLMIGAANRDPDEFPEPGVWNPERADVARRHVAFGGGQHGCAGQVLARAQGDIAISELFRRFPEARISGEVVWNHTEFIRGLVSLPMSV